MELSYSKKKSQTHLEFGISYIEKFEGIIFLYLLH